LHFTDSFADFVFWMRRLVITWMWLLYRLCLCKIVVFWAVCVITDYSLQTVVLFWSKTFVECLVVNCHRNLKWSSLFNCKNDRLAIGQHEDQSMTTLIEQKRNEKLMVCTLHYHCVFPLYFEDSISCPMTDFVPCIYVHVKTKG
jgi:hypothetical protein